jgi:HK97 family phage prohead protease
MTDSIDYECKFSGPSDAGEFSGLASCFGQEDLVGDVVAPGAFKRTLSAHRAAGRTPAMLWAHNPAEVIGRWLDIAETPEGLHVRGKLNLQTQRGAEARALMLDGSISGLSIGFRTRSAKRRSKGRVLTDLDLIECSIVSIPCAPNARVASVKEMPTMSLELSVPDDVPETAHDLPPEVIARLDSLETKAAAADADLRAKLDRIETRLNRPGAKIEVKEDQAELESKAFLTWCRKGAEGLNDLEKKVLSTIAGSPTFGGWNLVPELFLTELNAEPCRVHADAAGRAGAAGERQPGAPAEAHGEPDRGMGGRDGRARGERAQLRAAKHSDLRGPGIGRGVQSAARGQRLRSQRRVEPGFCRRVRPAREPCLRAGKRHHGTARLPHRRGFRHHRRRGHGRHPDRLVSLDPLGLLLNGARG